VKATQKGIELDAAELKALVAFTGEMERGMDAVHFRVTPAPTESKLKMVVTASDGHRLVEVEAFAEKDALEGEWAVAKELLQSCSKELVKDSLCVLRVERAGLRKARIVGIEDNKTIMALECPREAASTQISMTTILEVSRTVRRERRLTGSWFAVRGSYLAEFQLVSKAAGGSPVSVYPPVGPDSPIGFEASGTGGTWTGVLMPVRVVGPGEGIDEEAMSEAEEAVERMKEKLDELGATMSVDVDGVVTTIGKGRKNSKKQQDLVT
jgi:hypothetical protein